MRLQIKISTKRSVQNKKKEQKRKIKPTDQIKTGNKEQLKESLKKHYNVGRERKGKSLREKKGKETHLNTTRNFPEYYSTPKKAINKTSVKMAANK